MHNIGRIEPGDHFTQTRPKAGDGGPAWYAPQRDLLPNFSKWIRSSLMRFDGQELDPDLREKVMQTVLEMAALVNDAHEGKFAGKPGELEYRLRQMMENEAGYACVGAAFLTEMLWQFWVFAGDVSLRQEGPIKL